MRFPVVVLVVLAAAPVDLLELERLPPGARLGPEWKFRTVGSSGPPDFAVVETNRGRALRVSGRGKAAWALRELPHPMPPGPGELRWEWRVLAPPDGADLRDRRTDDAALRVFVVFGEAGGLSRGNRAIFYTWGNREPEGLNLPSHVSGRLHVVRLAGASEVGPAWRAESVNPSDDYRWIWGREAEPITAVGLMQDTDMTGAAVVGELRALMWDPGS